MSNPTTPFGFLDNGLMDGNVPNFGIYSGSIAATNTNSIYAGDIAKPISGGYFDVFTAAVGGGEAIGGIFVEFSWLSKSAGMLVRNRAWLGQTGDIAGGVVNCKLYVARDGILTVRSSGASGSPVAATNVGQFGNFSIGTPGANLVSAFQFDDSTLNATQGSLPFQVYALVQAPASDPASVNNIIQVRMVNLAFP